jgi:prepilin-type N-terminal cleavage/methylation domain-containing protein
MTINRKGFTLLEVLITLALITILSSVTYVIIDPAARFEDARNGQRASDVQDILRAILLYQNEHERQLPPEILSLIADHYYAIGTGDTCAGSCQSPDISIEDDCLDLGFLVTGGFITRLPIDPDKKIATDENTGYYLKKDENMHLEIGNCHEEAGHEQEPLEIIIRK